MFLSGDGDAVNDWPLTPVSSDPDQVLSLSFVADMTMSVSVQFKEEGMKAGAIGSTLDLLCLLSIFLDGSFCRCPGVDRPLAWESDSLDPPPVNLSER